MIALLLALQLTTTCTSYTPGTTTCQVQTPPPKLQLPPPIDYSKALAPAAGQPINENERNGERASNLPCGTWQGALFGCSAEATSRARYVQFRNTVGSMVADGRCEEAKAMALKGGDFDLADKAVRLCTPKP